MSEEKNKMVVFQEKEIRRVWHQEEWWFAIVDIIEVLTGSERPRKYWNDLKKKLQNEGADQLSEKIGQLKIKSSDGKMYATDCANTETMFRIIQSIPSPKAEPFKAWLAKVGYERIQEIENPELAAQRSREYYQALGYSEEWIERRMQAIAVRGQLTDEWKSRGVQEGQEFAILTAEISRATFGLTPSEYKDLKGLTRENLRDHMTGLELIFTMLGEEGTRIEASKADAQGFMQNKDAALKGGTAAGKALDAFEESTGDKVVTGENYKQQIEEAKQQRRIGGKNEKEKNSGDN